MKEILLASALTLAAIVTTPSAFADDVMAGDLMIMNTWSKQSPMGANVAAGFMTIMNHGSADERLMSATSEVTANTQVHEMKMEGDTMKMAEMMDGLVIPAGGTVELKPGSYHIMFIDMAAQPAVGSTFKGTLTFEKAGKVDVVYTVKPMQ
jgi:copper(I)-binding protein